jgi:transketolase
MNSFTPKTMRELILRESKRAHVGHIGSALSVVEILVALFRDVLSIENGAVADRFILSKGQAALALYCALYLRGIITEEYLGTFCTNGSLLGSHPSHELAGVEFSTGSLGQGLSYACGLALAGRLSHESYSTYVLLSDAECEEGSVWESAMFAAHHKLSSLCAVVDMNGQQAFGMTKDILDQRNMDRIWEDMGWEMVKVDGHNVDDLTHALTGERSGKPRVVLASTIAGKGVDFMEGAVKWHYWPMSDMEYNDAMRQVGASA